MHEKLSRGLNFGLIGNLLFIAFGLICGLYYATYDAESVFSKVLEVIAYLCEFSGFALLILSDWLIAKTTRMRMVLKICFTLYIIMEAVMMYLELNAFHLWFYKPYSLLLAIVHSIASAAVCFTFLTLDPYKNKFEAMVIICIGIILGGMFGNLIGIRIYFSIIVNAVSFSILFYAIKYLLKRDEIEIDCHGDSAREAVFKSPFFEDEPADKNKK